MRGNKQAEKVLTQISKNVKSKKWNCIEPNCKEQAINSHMLQRNGILNILAVNNHLIEIAQEDYFKWEKNSPLKFKRKGLNRDAFSLKLFCKDHDNSIFKTLETEPIDFKCYENQLLLTYRSVCAEKRKKEINLEFLERALKSEILYPRIDMRPMESFVTGNNEGIKDLDFYQSDLISDIKNKTKVFHFEIFEYDLIEVYSTTNFSPYETLNTPIEERPLKLIFIHTIPYKRKLHIIVGYNKKYFKPYFNEYIKSWEGLSFIELQENLTNLFATKTENWGMSISLYESLNSQNIKSFMKYFQENSMNHLFNQKVNFNLFQ